MSHVEVKDSEISFKLGSSAKTLFLGMMGIGIASFFAGYFGMHDTTRHAHSNPAWSGLLVGVYLVFAISIMGLFFTAISHVTGASWSITTRRIAENAGMFLPVFLILLLAVFAGMHDLYEWTHEEVAKTDHLIKHKAGYLNTPFFVGRLFVLTLLWSLFAYTFRKRSIDQDSSKDVEISHANERLSAGFLFFFAVTYSVAAFDLLMSLSPHWFSTMFGVYMFGAAGQTFFAIMAIVIYHMKKNGYLGDAVNENHIHDIGKWMLSFTVFWAYTGYSQYMLIWYANIPEETFFYEHRLTGGWTSITIALIVIKFLVPFFMLLNRPNKRNINFLYKVSLIIVFAQVFELFWLVFPSNFPNFNVMGLVLSYGISIGTLGLFGFFLGKNMESSKLIPVGDPRLEESLNHHQ